MSSIRRDLLAVVSAAVLFLSTITPAAAAGDPGWVHWGGVPQPENETWIRTIASQGTFLYAGSEGDGVFQSKDKGLTWTAWSTGLPDGTSVRQILATATNLQIATDNGIFEATVNASGVATSDWLPLGQGDGPDKINGDVQTLLDVSPTVTLAGVLGVLRKSTDKGDTWTDSMTGMPVGTTVWSLDSFAALPGHILAASSSGVFESTNGGSSWEPVTDGLPTGSSILRVAADPHSPTTWYAVTSGAGIYKSDTAGMVWEPINNDIGNVNTHAIAILPISPTKVAIAVGTADGVWMSNDGGDHWQHLANTGYLGHTSVWALAPVSTLDLTLLSGNQGWGVNRRIMAPPANTVLPTIVDQTPTVGALETSTDGTWTGTDQISYFYQWQRCVSKSAGTCTDIPNAIEPSYTPIFADEGRYLRLAVRAENAVTLPDALPVAYSGFTSSAVAANPSTLPGANQLPNPGFSGNPLNVQVGTTLTATPGTWNPTASFLYQWFRCDTTDWKSCIVTRAFAATATWTVVKADAGKYIGVVIKGTNAHGSATSGMTMTSSPVLPPQVTSTSAPKITGGPWVGKKMTGATGSFSGPTEYLWTTWQRCDTAAGAGCVTANGSNSATYTPNSSELGKYLRLKVEADVNGPFQTPASLVVYSPVVGPITSGPTAPGAPTAVAGAAGNAKVTVTWKAPASNGGSPVTSYAVTSTPGAKKCTTAGTLTCTVTGLTNGTAYTFKVVAFNAVGAGAASAASSAVTPRTVPGAPTAVVAKPASTKAAVTWKAPASNGGAAITNYTVTSSPGAKTCTTTGTLTCTVTGLINNTAYTFTVKAANAAGTGAASAASAAVKPGVVPGAPTTVAGTPGNTQAVVTWHAPASPGSSAIKSYKVTSTPGAKTCSTTGALTCTVIGLTNGTAYKFTVVASNQTGAGPASTASAAVTPRTIPGAPTAVTAAPGATSAAVSWKAPTSTGGAAITKYTVTSTPGGKTCVATTGLSCTVSGLTGGTVYTFKVVATNAAGNGPASAASPKVICATGTIAVALGSGTIGQPAAAPIPLALTWTTAVPAASVASFKLQTQVAAGAWTAVALGSPAATKVSVTAARGSKVSYRVAPVTTTGATGPWTAATAFTPTSIQENDAKVVYSAAWTSATSASAYGGKIRHTSTASRTATLKASARAIGWVATLGKDRGKAEVWVDGSKAATISLYAATTTNRQIVWSKVFASAGPHTVQIKVLGQHATGSTGNRVDLDGFLVLAP